MHHRVRDGNERTVEELDNVSEIHSIVQYDITIGFHHCQGDEENESLGDCSTGSSDNVPYEKDIFVDKF